jgi:hypothetical protein
MYDNPGTRVDVWAEIQFHVFTSARVNEYIESTCFTDFKAFAFLIKYYSSAVATHPIHPVYNDTISNGGGRAEGWRKLKEML